MSLALLLIDIQNDYFPGGKNPLEGSLEASQKARMALEHFRSHRLPVIHIQHFSTRPGARFFLPGTPGAEIHENVCPLPEEIIIPKNYPNSFRETPLLETLHNLGIGDLAISGMMTHMCVDATTRAACDAGFSCTLLHDACATKQLSFCGKAIPAEQVHLSFLAALSSMYAKVISTEEFLATQ